LDNAPVVEPLPQWQGSMLRGLLEWRFMALAVLLSSAVHQYCHLAIVSRQL
jgi:hypothetical protein